MDPVTFWRKFTANEDDSSSSETTFLNIEAVYSMASEFAILSMLDQDNNGVYGTSPDVTPGSFSLFTPSVEANPTGKIDIATLSNNKPATSFRSADEQTEIQQLNTYASDHINTIVNVESIYFNSGAGDMIRTNVSTDGGVTWSDYTQLLVSTATNFSRGVVDIIYHSAWQKFVVLDSRGSVWLSTDGQTWTGNWYSPYAGAGDKLLEVGNHLYSINSYYQNRYSWCFDFSGNRTEPNINETSGINWRWPTSSRKPSSGHTFVSTTNNLYKVSHSDPANPVEVTQTEITGATTKFAAANYWVGYDHNNNKHWLVLSDNGNWNTTSYLYTSSDDGVTWVESTTNIHGIPYFGAWFDRQLNQFIWTTNYHITNIASTVNSTDVQFTTIDNTIYDYTWLPTGPIWTQKDSVTNEKKTFRLTTPPTYSSSFDPTTATTEPVPMWFYKQTGTDEIIEDIWVTRDPLSTDPSAWTYITTNLSNAIVSEFGISRASYGGTDRSVVIAEYNNVIQVALRLEDEGMVAFSSPDNGTTWNLIYNGYRTLKNIVDVTPTEDDRWYDTRNVDIVVSAGATEQPTFDLKWAYKTTDTAYNISSGLVQPGIGELSTFLFKINGDTSYYWPADKYRVIKEPTLVSWDAVNPTNPGANWFVTEVVITPPIVEGLEPGDIVQVQIWLGFYSNLHRVYADFTVDTSQSYLTTCSVVTPGKGIQSQKVDININPESGTTNGAVHYKAATIDNRIPKNFSKADTLQREYLHSIPANYTINDPLMTDSIHYGEILYRENTLADFVPTTITGVSTRRYLSGGTTEDTTAAAADAANPRTIVTGLADVAPASYYTGAYGYLGGSANLMATIKQEYFDSGNYTVTDQLKFLYLTNFSSWGYNLSTYIDAAPLTSADMNLQFSAGSGTGSSRQGVYAFEDSVGFKVASTINTYSSQTAVPVLTYNGADGAESISPSTEWSIAEHDGDKMVIIGNKYIATSTNGTAWTVMKLIDELGL